MFYFYILLFYSSSILLEIQYIKKKISNEYILLFITSICYTNIYILQETYFNNNIINIENPIFLFTYFFIFMMSFYISMFYFLFYSMQQYYDMNHVYFIEY